MAGETALPIVIGEEDDVGIEILKGLRDLKGVELKILEEIVYLNKNIGGLIEEQRNLYEKQEIMEMDRVYEKYGKPLEKEHKGKFACITPDGEYVIGEDSIDAFKKAEKEGLEDCVLFQIGNPGGGIDM